MQGSLPPGGLRLDREGFEPSGSRRRVSGHITILLSRTYPDARVVYAKRPFGGPEAVLAYLSRYTHQVAIFNSRLVSDDDRGVTIRWKDYRARDGAKGREWIKAMTLGADEFIRRFLLHVLPDGFHRIRHYGLFASGCRAANVARIRILLAPASLPSGADPEPVSSADAAAPGCLCCGGRLVIVERFRRGETPRIRPTAVRIDTS